MEFDLSISRFRGGLAFPPQRLFIFFRISSIRNPWLLASLIPLVLGISSFLVAMIEPRSVQPCYTTICPPC